MTRRRKPRARSPKAGSVPPPSSQRGAGEEQDASARQVQAEGVDAPAPKPPHPRRPQRPAAPPPAGPKEPVVAVAPEAIPPERPSDPNVVARIRDLEARLDRMIDAHSRGRDHHDGDGSHGSHLESRPPPAPPSRSQLPQPSRSQLPQPPPSRTSRPPSMPAPHEPEGMLETARELLSTDFYLRKWGRLGLRNRSEEVDEFGYDPVYEQKVLPFFQFLYAKYFRVEVHGVENVPGEGRCLLVANHSGTLPVDGMMLRLAVKREHPQRRDVRWLAEDVIFHFPFLGAFSNRLGAVRACQENAERLLDHGSLVAVFPEGLKGIGKLFRDRYKLQRFGRGGFVKLGLRTRTPVVPVAIVGGEETNPMLARVEALTRAVGIPYVPVTPTFPLLGPVGLLPAPTKWKVYFGRPVDLEAYGAESAEDEILVGRLTEQVRAEIQGMLDRAVAERRSVWFG